MGHGVGIHLIFPSEVRYVFFSVGADTVTKTDKPCVPKMFAVLEIFEKYPRIT